MHAFNLSVRLKVNLQFRMSNFRSFLKSILQGQIVYQHHEQRLLPRQAYDIPNQFYVRRQNADYKGKNRRNYN